MLIAIAILTQLIVIVQLFDDEVLKQELFSVSQVLLTYLGTTKGGNYYPAVVLVNLMSLIKN